MCLVGTSLLAEAATSLGDARRASALYGVLLPYADRVAINHPEIATGSVSRYLGMLAAIQTRWVDAEHHFETALEINERIGARPWLAHTQRDYADMLLARDDPGDIERALLLVSDAAATYRELGMQTYEASSSALAAHLRRGTESWS